MKSEPEQRIKRCTATKPEERADSLYKQSAQFSSHQ